MLIAHILNTQRYFGRGILVGTSSCGSYAFWGYFLMGRSAQSQNRLFTQQDHNVHIAFITPPSGDTSLIFYPPILHQDPHVIITNGSQTQVIAQALREGQSFYQALHTQSFEPDSPHFTPRISALIQLKDQSFSYQMSLIKALRGANTLVCSRYFYDYESLPGRGHFLHTYAHDATPLPSFCGEPKQIAIPPNLSEFGTQIWQHLDPTYKVALCVQSLHLHTHQVQTLIFNKDA
ncbi:IMP cyclohydrolase [Helicobacter salomonis]|uniref:IMP cyclohydrolase n=1 Tax=Helicobacter salomonis TaxID=56878 RepID=UPI001F1DF702|nr:IMP cyclohydrolase [Helicobacter salomonis]